MLRAGRYSSNSSIASAGDSTVQIDGAFPLHGTPYSEQTHIDVKTSTAKSHFIIPSVKWD